MPAIEKAKLMSKNPFVKSEKVGMAKCILE
jgi:hypothetical protein